MDGVETPPPAVPIPGDDQANALRFEDLTIDDDLPLLDRVVRYCRSGIALQRLVHVKMLAETAETVGSAATIQTLVPLLNPLVADPESIIRQHLATQLLPFSIACMVEGVGPLKKSVSDYVENPSKEKHYNDRGYNVVTSTIITHLNKLVMDTDVDVRRSASDALSGLALQIRSEDIGAIVMPIPLRLANPNAKPKKGEPENLQEELRITAANLLAELSGASESGHMPRELIQKHVLPCILSLANDSSFRVRRSASQALPRVLGGTSLDHAKQDILPAFDKLSKDEMYRVRKSTGECLVDMSRSLMILASDASDSRKAQFNSLRRSWLIPVAIRLLEDVNKFVRHGMMQFLGPFIASFYPLNQGEDALGAILPGASLDLDGPPPMDGSSYGIGTQFFPHASSMVSRLNSSANANASAPTPTPASFHTPSPVLTEMEELQQQLPPFLRANQLSILSLRAVIAHRETNPPDPEDVTAIATQLLKHFVELSIVSTGDENTDAEMRVYCAYSYPAVVLLLGAANWDGMLKDCFFNLINPSTSEEDDTGVPPLPVKRCLASSLHTVAYILGPEVAQSDVLPVFREHFFRDTDDSVRLNVLRNFPWLLSLMPSEMRIEYLSMWYEIVKGEDLLGAHKRSATNPMLLNWRQRDAVSRSMCDLLGLVEPALIQKLLWPILKMLLTDSVSLVREDAEWSIPLLLRSYCPRSDVSSDKGSVGKRWAADACQEVVAWLKETILGSSSKGQQSGGQSGRPGNFAKRQLYCRICASVGLAVRFSDVIAKAEADKTLTADQILQDLLESAGPESKTEGQRRPYVPFQSLAADERKHLLRLLGNELVPPALEMKDDRVTNVRLTLMKCLHLMPDDVRNLPNVSSVLQELEDEMETWESVYGTGEATLMSVAQSVNGPVMVSVVSPEKSKATEKESNSESRTTVQQRVSVMEKSRKRSKKTESSGPVDVDTLAAV